MRRHLFTLLLLIIPVCIHAQEGFKKGFVLLTKTDTIFGLIENDSFFNNSTVCNFKKDESAQVTHYTPDQIFGYYFNSGKYYVSKEVDGNRCFLEFIVEGKLNVYFTQDKDLNNRYFIEKDTLPLRELVYKKEVLVDDDGIQRVSRSKTHNQLLSYYTNDCPQLKETAMTINKPEAASLIRFAEDYHNAVCTDEKCIVYEKKQKTVFELELSGGASMIFPDDYKHIHRQTFATGGLMLGMMIPSVSESIYGGVGVGFFEYTTDVLSKIVYIGDDLNGDPIYINYYDNRFKRKVQIPVTIYYNNHRKGISPIAGVSVNALHFFIDCKAYLGLNYQIDQFAIKLYGDGTMYRDAGFNVYEYYSSVRLGVSYLFK
jgi:hypothetical protein